MTDEIAALAELKDVDIRVVHLTKVISSVPERLGELNNKVEFIREEYAKKRAQLEEFKVKRRAKEKGIEDFSEKIRKFEFQQYDVKTNKEYQTLLHEIAVQKEKRSHLEGEIIELMELEETSAKELKEFEVKIKKEEALAADEKGRLEQELEDAKRQLDVIMEQREFLLDRLSVPVRSRYDRVIGGKGRTAVAAVKNRGCGACFTGLPPQTLNEIRKGLEVISCETCGRMLVWSNESGQ
ncbi:MAG: C4-type zinc ribbon domain-containing protein [Candidatus Eisenbacteria bacterium]|nr:C4-type zinc ribbon domain-containing protein [Candidatus Eisenbacteria bacterium]